MANITLDRARALGIVVQSAVAMVDARLRVAVAIVITRTFACVNLVVLAMVLLFFIVDHASQNSPVVTGRTVRVLIGASVVQLGVIALAIGRYLFPSPRPWSLRDRIWGR